MLPQFLYKAASTKALLTFPRSAPLYTSAGDAQPTDWGLELSASFVIM